MSELGVSSINLLGCPRFPAYSVGHLSFAPQSNPTELNPRVPWGPAMGTPRGPPPQFPPQYSQVIPNKEAIWLYAELFLGHHDGSCHGLW